MPRSLIAKIPAIMLIGLAVGGVVAASVQGLREPASGSADFASLSPQHPFRVFAGKSQAFLLVNVSPVGEIPAEDHEVAELRVSVRAQKDFPAPLQVSWDLPSEVEIVEGRASTEHPAPKAGEVIELSVKLKGFSREARRLVGVQALVNVEGAEMGNSAVITSLPEESFEMLETAASGVRVESGRKPALKGKIIR